MEIIEGKLKVTCCGNCCFSNYSSEDKDTWISCLHPDREEMEAIEEDFWYGNPKDIPPKLCPLRKAAVYVHLGEEIITGYLS